MELSKEEHQLSYIRLDDRGPKASEATKSRPLSYAEKALLQSQARGFWGASWILEILSCLICVGFLAGITVVLFKYDGKPIPDWPYGITINALVAVFSTAMKAAMAFMLAESLAQLKWSWFRGGNKLSDLALLDAASRGAAGAFVVLFRFLPCHLVTFGCLLLVVTTATDPFVQQTVGTEPRAVQTPGQAYIQVCNTSLYTDHGEGDGPGNNKVTLGTAAAIYGGIFQNQTPNSKSIMMNCPTGNCTFEPYQSLGFCSRCANITDSLRLSKPASGMTGTYQYTLPNGLEFNTMSGLPYLMNSTVELDFLKLNTDGMALVTNFTAITADSRIPPQPSAIECALFFCIDTFEADVKEGSFSENRTSIGISSNTSSSGDHSLTPHPCYSSGTRYQNPYEHPEHCTYNVDRLSRLALSNSLAPLLIGNGSIFSHFRSSWSSDTIEAVYGREGNYTDINSVFESLASSLTINARSKICQATIDGTCWTYVSFVHVRWVWLILPATLVGVSIGFLAVTIRHTRNQYIWKSSPLALLFSDLTVDTSRPLNSSPTLKGMEEISSKMEVWLETSHEGVKLKAVAT